jgi:subtilisin family serine protease
MRLKGRLFFLLLFGLWPISASAHNRFIVRDTAGLASLQQACASVGCTVVNNVDGNLNQVFLVTAPRNIDPGVILAGLLNTAGITSAELDQVLVLTTAVNQVTAPPAGLSDSSPVQYFGASVANGYVNQPAAQIVRVSEAQSTFHVAGSGIVADIDTGVDPNHPALQGVLLPGWDFTRNQPGGSELTDLQPAFASPAPCSACQPATVNQSTAAVLDQSTAAVLEGNPQYAAFGHGTMVMGVIHLVAPQAMLLPLKAFHSDGTGFLSDILSAIYFAVQNQANVINMSFDTPTNSHELSKALDYANRQGVICSASAGNEGQIVVVYPAAFQSAVIGVASTNDLDQRSIFSNYGDAIVWVAAPGEAVISTYPFSTYAAAWGTSFSAPFVAGAAALLLDQQPGTDESQAAAAVAHAVPIGPDMGNGRLDLVQALAANGLPKGDFSIAQSHQRGRIHGWRKATFTFNVVASADFTGSVALSVSGLPSNTSAEFDPPAITGSGKFVLTLWLDDDTPPGSYDLTITGTSGSLLHSVDVELNLEGRPLRRQ